MGNSVCVCVCEGEIGKVALGESIIFILGKEDSCLRSSRLLFLSAKNVNVTVCSNHLSERGLLRRYLPLPPPLMLRSLCFRLLAGLALGPLLIITRHYPRACIPKQAPSVHTTRRGSLHFNFRRISRHPKLSRINFNSCND